MTRSARLASVAAIALAFGTLAPAGWARGGDREVLPFDEASLFFELNDTDEDLGIHALIDGDLWRRLDIADPDGRRILSVSALGRLRKQGLTELFFESDEPNFADLAPAEFFARFPEGEYRITGVTLENDRLASTVEVSHVMPAPPDNVLVSGVPAAEDCDADPLPVVGTPVVIAWDPVEDSHPEVGESGEIEVEKYQVVVEREEPEPLVLSVELPPGETSFELPEAFTDLAEELKLEILVRASTGNQTAVESCFALE